MPISKPNADRFVRCAATCVATVLVTMIATMIALPKSAAAMDLNLALDATRTFLTSAWAASSHWTIENYGRAPALIVGLAALLLLPPLALASGLITRFALPRPRIRPSPNQDAATQNAPPARHPAPDHPSNMAWPREAWLTGSSSVDARRPPLLRTLPRELLSIGRGEDNDLVLDEATVHRYHAIIQRTPDALFLIKDLGGPGGNGVFVNNERVTEAHLIDADRISLGSATLIFHARRVGDHSTRLDNAA
jgi:FHA domain